MGTSAWTPVDESAWKPVDEAPASSPITPMGVLGEMATQGKDVLRGIGQGVISSGMGALNLGAKLSNAVTPSAVAPPVPPPFSGETIKTWTAPENTAQTIGKFGEQAAEFAIPATGISKLTKGAGLLMRLGAEALGAGGVAALQSGGNPSSTMAGAVAGAAGPILGAGARAAGSKFAPKLYQSALKPTWAMVKKEGLEMVETGMKEGIPVSHKGLSMAESRIDSLRSKITAGITNKAALGKTVDTTKVLSTLDELEDFYRNSAAPEDGLKTLQDLRDEFTKYHGTTIPIDAAQKIKVNTYRLLKKSYGEFKGAKIEGLKAEARGLKEQISAVFPEIAGLNERQSKLLGLDEAMTRAVWRIDNHQMMGIGSPMAAVAGHALLGGPGAAAWFVGKLVLDDPGIKSRLAIGLARSGVKNAPKVVGARMAAWKGAIEEIAAKAAKSPEAIPAPVPAPAILPLAAGNNPPPGLGQNDEDNR